MTQLAWYPHNPKEWQQRCEGLSLEERGALQLVLDASWHRTPACTIADTPAEFQLLLGHRWAKLAVVIRRHFTPDIEHPGRLRCDWLAELHANQVRRYETRAKLGARGGQKSAADRQLAKERGQTRLFKRGRAASTDNAAESSLARSPASSLATSPASVAQLAQKLESSLRTTNLAAVAAASNAPAAQNGRADGWVGPELHELRTWADADPGVQDAVSARIVAATALEDQANPNARITFAMVEQREREALRAEYAARHPRQEAG